MACAPLNESYMSVPDEAVTVAPNGVGVMAAVIVTVITGLDVEDVANRTANNGTFAALVEPAAMPMH